MGFVMRWLLAAVVAFTASTMPALAALSVTDETTCRDIIRHSLAGDDVAALHRAIGRYAAAIFTHYGLPAPKNLEDFGMNVGVECIGLPPGTSVLVVSNKVLAYWHD
jgi:hypothetical protein